MPHCIRCSVFAPCVPYASCATTRTRAGGGFPSAAGQHQDHRRPRAPDRHRHEAPALGRGPHREARWMFKSCGTKARQRVKLFMFFLGKGDGIEVPFGLRPTVRSPSCVEARPELGRSANVVCGTVTSASIFALVSMQSTGLA